MRTGMHGVMRAVAVLGLMVAATVSDAGTIISVSGPVAGGYTIGAGIDTSTSTPGVEILAVSWSQTQLYSNVAISALLNSTQVGNTVDAYLVQGTVPQPAAEQIAHSTVSIAAGIGTYTFFSGLTLSAGTYSLALDSFTSQPDTVGWRYTISPTIVQDTGVTLPHALYSSPSSSNSSQPPYPPNATFQPLDSIGNLEFSVVSLVPEPASLVMLSIGLATVARLAWRRRHVA